MSKVSFDHIIIRWMAPVFTCFWFYLIESLFFLIGFIAPYVFRINDSSKKEMRDFSVQVETEPEANEIEERDFADFNIEEEEEEEEQVEEEEEISNFSFKFEYQIPKNIIKSNEEPSVALADDIYQTKTHNVSSHQFSTEKALGGIVEETEAMTFQVQESFVHYDDIEVKSEPNSSPPKGLEKPAIQNNSSYLMFLKNQSLEKRRLNLLARRSLSRKQVRERLSATNFTDTDSDSGSITSTDSKPNTEEEAKEVNFLKNQSSEEKKPNDIETEQLREKDNIGNYSGFDSDSDLISLSGGDFVKTTYIPTVDGVLFPNDQSLEHTSPIALQKKPSSEKEAIGSFSGFNSDSDSVSLTDGYSVKNLMVDSESDGFLSDEDFDDNENLIDAAKIKESQFSYSIGGFPEISERTNFESFLDTFRTEGGFDEIEKVHRLQGFRAEICSPWTDRLSQLDEIWSENESLEPELQLKELSAGGEAVDSQLPSSATVQREFMDSSDDELSSSQNCSNDSGSSNLGTETTTNSSKALESEGCEKRRGEDTEKSEEANLNNLEAEDLDELESLWEQQDLIEQLKMELKRVRATGLPTIFEESESPKEIEDLKPWKIDEKFFNEDPINELHKCYKSYRERMRKFDILNYQKMYAISFLQLKDPLESMGAHKPLLPTILSQLSQNLRPFNRRKSSAGASEKFIRELQIDLETVYVGQTCLSWEFLRWQYEKARELPESDPYRCQQYNQVAGEFQQFHVIMQRFIENESFQGPRLPNYVKNRCVLRNLLQVPVVKEDCLKDKMEGKEKGNGAITSEMLEDIMEECIRVFWEFVKADRDETSTILKGLIGNQTELEDPANSHLMAAIHASLQKKDKKLKDILKTGNCLVKKFKKPREDRSNLDLFFSQVDMKLVSRVLKMSKITTEQLVWCHNKLEFITFVDRKIHREPSFVLFPC